MAVKQYFKYFMGLFIALGAALVIFIVTLLGRDSAERSNHNAPAERVYDYAEVLSDEEEEKLRSYIAECEQKARIDIIVVTINEDVESQGDWESVMEARADDFYDHNSYGFDKVYGDGILLLDNYFEGQMGTVTSTCGRVFEEFGYYENEKVLDAVYDYIETDPYRAYRAFVSTSTNLMTASEMSVLNNLAPGLLFMALICPPIVTLIFGFAKVRQPKAKKTTQPGTYLADSSVQMNVNTDTFLRENTVSRRIETSSGSSSSTRSRSGGGGGARRSSSGVRHGGGSRRR